MTYNFTKAVKVIAVTASFMGMMSVDLYAQRQGLTAGADSSKAAGIKTDQIKVSGVITDAQSHKPIPGIGVSVASYSAAITDERGQFTITVPDLNTALLVSGQGYQKKEVVIKGKKNLKIGLYPDSYNSIYESAVMPYGVKSKLRIANAVESVNTDDNWQRASESSDTYLQGRMLGVNVIRRSGTPGVGGNLFVNGFNSLTATNQPLIVIDGMLYDNVSYGTSLISGHVQNPLSNIDIKDISSYTLIKDGASFYGTRGANGVLLITSNRAKGQATTIDFAAYGAYNSRPSSLPVMKASDYRIYLSDLLKTVPGETAASISAKPYMNDESNPNYYQFHNETDWQKQVLDNTYNQNYYLKITGGDDIATYGLSVGYLKGSGITTNTDLQRYQTRFNADLNLSSKLTAAASLSFVNNQQNLQEQGIARKTNPLYVALVKSPFLAPHDINEFNEASPNFAGVDSLNFSNPSALIDKVQGANKNYRFLGNVSFNYKVNKKLSLMTLLGVNFSKVRENLFIPKLGVVADTLASAVTTNSSGSNTQRLYSLFNDTRASFTTRINRIHNLSVNAGLRFNNNDMEVDYGNGYNSATDNYVSVGGGLAALRTVGGQNGKWNWLNLYGNVDYELLDKYFLSLNLASDASSRFGKTAKAPITINGNKFSFMPSIAAGWLISSESFMSGASFIDVLKLRASYGIVGNDDIGNYSATQYYVSQNLLGAQTLVRGNIANTGLKWESVKKAGAGLDAAFFNERLNVSLDYFNNHSTDMISFRPTPRFSGVDYVLANNSAMKTQGLNLGISGRVLNKVVTWDLGLNVSRYKNKVTQVPSDMFLTQYAGGTLITQVGKPANQFWGYQALGVYSSDAEAAATGLKNRFEDGTVRDFRGGDMKFADVNKDGFIDNSDRQVIGDPNPDFTGALNTTLAYKRWSMDASLTFSSGNDIYNYTRRQLVSMSGFENQLLKVNNRWRAQGQVTDVPRAEFGDPAGNARFSDAWIEDGSYLRLRTISLSYNVPLGTKALKSARVYLTGNNVFTVTKYLGYDPEFSADGNIFSQGTDIGLEPQFRTIQLGVRIGL